MNDIDSPFFGGGGCETPNAAKLGGGSFPPIPSRLPWPWVYNSWRIYQRYMTGLSCLPVMSSAFTNTAFSKCPHSHPVCRNWAVVLRRTAEWRTPDNGSVPNMGVGAYLFGEGYPSPMFQNGEGSFTNILAKLSKNGASPALDGFLSRHKHTDIMSKRVSDACRWRSKVTVDFIRQKHDPILHQYFVRSYTYGP